MVVLLTTDTWAVAVAVVLSLPDDADLFLGVAVLPGRGEVGGVGRVLRVSLTTFPPRPVEMREVDLDLLVGGGDRVLLLGLTIGGGEDAEGDGDSRFKIQVDCLDGRAESSSPLPCIKEEEKIPLASSWGKKSKEKEREREGPYQLDGTDSFCLDSEFSIEIRTWVVCVEEEEDRRWVECTGLRFRFV